MDAGVFELELFFGFELFDFVALAVEVFVRAPEAFALVFFVDVRVTVERLDDEPLDDALLDALLLARVPLRTMIVWPG